MMLRGVAVLVAGLVALGGLSSCCRSRKPPTCDQTGCPSDHVCEAEVCVPTNLPAGAECKRAGMVPLACAADHYCSAKTGRCTRAPSLGQPCGDDIDLASAGGFAASCTVPNFCGCARKGDPASCRCVKAESRSEGEACTVYSDPPPSTNTPSDCKGTLRCQADCKTRRTTCRRHPGSGGPCACDDECPPGDFCGASGVCGTLKGGGNKGTWKPHL